MQKKEDFIGLNIKKNVKLEKKKLNSLLKEKSILYWLLLLLLHKHSLHAKIHW
jgi:hypothetical protein